MPIADYMPKNKREIAALIGGAALALGASQIPGVTFEASELTDCKLALVALEATTAAEAKAHVVQTTEHLAARKDLEDRVRRCWERYRESRGLPVRVTMVEDDAGEVEGPYEVETAVPVPTPHD
jgi:hypothetical protein